ncbi:nodulation protein NfeD [Cohnella sp. REN36]|uniref:NfeD family protein n=1 Tax=Cohnella sp. REN36 TaxID=2887347 RepID=UPI001D14D33D|nr:NfeD family protein [Cohnella sp. REN36]MCC3372794.1 ATP-dependent Clp protease proteolytic subunit [Cohnella sp. REN36]
MRHISGFGKDPLGRRLLLYALTWMLLLLAAVPFVGPTRQAAAETAGEKSGNAEGYVYVIPIQMEVANGLASFVERAFAEAEKAGASLIVLDIDTPGGSLTSAEDIGKRIRSSKVETVAFVSGKAASAGAYLALNADRLVMAPGSTIGSAMVVNGSGQAVESPKIVSHWTSEMVAAAELNGRRADIAAGMVDPERTVEMKEIGRTKAKGEIISLSAEEARKVGYADATAGSIRELLAEQGLQDRAEVTLHPTILEKVAQVVTQPGITTLLLILGIAGVLIELLVPGFGIPGIVGLAAFGLYFFGQGIAGFAGMESIVFFLVGVVLLVLEMFVPSFGILGLLGAAGLIGGIVTAAYDTGDALRSLGWALLVALVLVAIVAYIFRRKGVWNRFILKESLTAEQGYVPHADARERWIGREGIALSPLRPAGIAEVDGKRIDVVTAGGFVDRGRAVRVTAVDGTRILVEEIS